MKQYLIIASASLLFVACGGSKEDNSDLAKLKKEKDSLTTLADEVGARVAEIDGLIADLDTTKKLTVVSNYQTSVESFKHYFEVHGVVETDQNVVIFPQAMGDIEKILVKEGQKVSKGQLLVQLDAEIIKRNIDEVETSLKLATTVYERQEKLWNQKIGSEIQYLEAETNKKSLENRLASLREQLAMSNVKAPFDGVVDEVFAKEGELAGQGTALVRLVNVSNIYIESDVSETYLKTIGKGSEVIVHFPSLEKEITAEIQQKGRFINPENRTFKIRVNIPNKDGDIIPNLLAELRIMDFESDSAVVIPTRLIQESPNGENFLYAIEKDGEKIHASKKVVETGYAYKGKTHVTAGLTGTEVLVDKGAKSVIDGQQVTLK